LSRSLSRRVDDCIKGDVTVSTIIGDVPTFAAHTILLYLDDVDKVQAQLEDYFEKGVWSAGVREVPKTVDDFKESLKLRSACSSDDESEE